MNSYVLPPVVAGLVAVVISVTRRLTPVLLESSVGVPSPRTLSVLVLGSRFVAFVLVYGLLFGLAFWVGTRRDDGSADGTLALATGAVAALTYLVGTGVVLLLVEAERDPLISALMTVGSSFSVGVQLATVTFAGVALAHRR